MARRTFGIAAPFAILTALTQIGGVVYLAAVGATRLASRGRKLTPWRRRGCVAAVTLGLYALATFAIVPPLAEQLGRIRLPCSPAGNIEPATWLTCALNRGFVTPDTYRLIGELGDEMARTFPGSRVTTLEASFPFVDGFPLPPHLSHRDGRKVDVAFFYKRADTDQPIAAGSPSYLGYFIYERPLPGEPAPCAGRWTPLRWNFAWLQPGTPAWRLDEQRTASMVQWLVGRPQVTRLFVEPYLAQRLGVAGGKVRFQGCWAARHDDHLHIEVQ